MLRNYLKVTLRSFWKARLFSTLNLVGMSIGVAAVGLMVLYIIHELSYDRFHAKADRIFRVVHYADWTRGSLRMASTSAPYAQALRHEYPQIEKAVRFHPEGGGVITYRNTRIDAPDIYFTDPSVFDVFTYPFLYGNPATALTRPETIVLTRTLAEKLFGDASKAVGQPIEFANHFVNTVTGVIEDVPAASHLQFSALRALPANYTNGWQNSELYTYVLLAKDSDPKTLEAKFPRFYQKYVLPEMGQGVNYRMEFQPLTAIHLHSHLDFEASPNGNINTVYIFAVLAALILLIACINYVNLYTARSAKRVREVGVRKAIGSQRSQLVGQFLVESFLMAFLATVLGFMLIQTALPFFNQLANKSLSVTPYGWPATVSLLVVFALALGLLSGGYPAVLLSRFRPVMALKVQTGNRIGGASFRKSLVVFQFMAAIVLIASSWVIYRQMGYVLVKDLGFNKDQVLTFHLDSKEARQQVQALKEELLKSPLIASASAASNPIGNNNIGTSGLFFEQANGAMATATQITHRFMADADFLRTLEIQLVKGRNFSDSSPGDATGAVLVNEALVRKMGWPSPIGKRIQSTPDENGQTKTVQVVGVIRDFHIYSLQHQIEPLILQLPPASDKDNLYVRIQPQKAAQALAYIEAVYKKFDPAAQPNIQFLDQNFARQYETEQRQATILLSFTVLAVLIACLGLFGLAAFTAEQRTKEIGIRKVLGASVASITVMLSRDFLKLVLIALVLATPIAWYAMNQWLVHFAYCIALHWWLFALAGGLALVIALLTVAFQAIKAALMDPVESLKTE